MLIVTSHNLIGLWAPAEGKEFTRYFSWFPLTALDQEVLCYHKKKIVTKRWKDIGSGVEIFLCRQKKEDIISPEMIDICQKYGEILIRDEIITGMQVHIPLTGEFLGKESYFTDMVSALWNQWYVVVQSIIQTKNFPLIQWSITDPTLLETLVSSLKQVEKTADLPIVQSISTVERRKHIFAAFEEWASSQWFDANLLDEYDVIVLSCDS